MLVLGACGEDPEGGLPLSTATRAAMRTRTATVTTDRTSPAVLGARGSSTTTASPTTRGRASLGPLGPDFTMTWYEAASQEDGAAGGCGSDCPKKKPPTARPWGRWGDAAIGDPVRSVADGCRKDQS